MAPKETDYLSIGIDTIHLDRQSNDPKAQTIATVDIGFLADRCLRLLDDAKSSSTGSESPSKALYRRQSSSFNDHQQIFVGIAGTPGSGKSFIARQVCDEINRRDRNNNSDAPECVVVGMDGYHLSRQELKKLSESGHRFKVDEFENEELKFSYVPMSYRQVMSRRGAAFTYSPETFIRDLGIIKETGQGSFPEYCRELHDPVPGGVMVKPCNRIILVEGLYLLSLNDPAWKRLGNLWDDTWLVDVSLPETKRRLVQRHLETWDDGKTEMWGGNDAAAATRKAETNDLVNAKCIQESSRDFANLIIQNERIPEDEENHSPTLKRQEAFSSRSESPP
ncbi:unnamed protein product [Cylindrotheca closterium]|uniref:Phosphoribulokinase/uridine kinase domain-containing protein n=1 Tax=Cylindrotheca closterium TaxID=2856 RepID=A0AAD2G6Q3_9STRA|nr:unnamed protein product [Cylindrotheca closterium]